MWLKTAAKYLRLTWHITRLDIKSAMEYRVSFIVQTLGMLINDLGFILLWIIFFAKFPEVNGWTINDMLFLFSFVTIVFALVMIFFQGAADLAKLIAQGQLDYYLALPKNTLWHLAVSKTDLSAIGDLFFGLIIYCFVGSFNPIDILLFIIIALLAGFIFLNFIIFTQSIGFWAGNFETAAEQLMHALLGFTLYPQTTFYGLLKIITMTIVPAFFTASLPVYLLKSFNWQGFLLLIAAAFITFCLAIIIFKKGLKRYESGNLLTVKL